MLHTSHAGKLIESIVARRCSFPHGVCVGRKVLKVLFLRGSPIVQRRDCSLRRDPCRIAKQVQELAFVQKHPRRSDTFPSAVVLFHWRHHLANVMAFIALGCLGLTESCIFQSFHIFPSCTDTPHPWVERRYQESPSILKVSCIQVVDKVTIVLGRLVGVQRLRTVGESVGCQA